MGQAILAQHGFQGVDLGGNVHAHILQKGVVQFGVGPIQRMQDGGDVSAALSVSLSPNPCAVSSSLRVVGR